MHSRTTNHFYDSDRKGTTNPLPRWQTLTAIIMVMALGVAGSNPAAWAQTPTPEPSILTYEDAEDGSNSRWAVLRHGTSLTEAATVSNSLDATRGNRVMVFGGDGDHSFRLLDAAGKTAWHDTQHLVAEWSLNFTEWFNVYIHVMTTDGPRTLGYRPWAETRVEANSTGTYVYHGLGTAARDGQWHLFLRDLQGDLATVQPGVTILEVIGQEAEWK